MAGDDLPLVPPAKIVKRRSKTQTALPAQHPLLRKVAANFEGVRELDNGLLKPTKVLMPDIICSKSTLSLALQTANELYLALEQQGHQVMIPPDGGRRVDVDEREGGIGHKQSYPSVWSPMRPTVTYLGTVSIGLTIFEYTEEVEVRYIKGKYVPVRDLPPSKSGRYDQTSWTTKKNVPIGRLCLQAYSPYYKAPWVRQWKQTTNRTIEQQINSIVRELEASAEVVAALATEGQRIAREEREKWNRDMAEYERRRREERKGEAVSESRKELLSIVDSWNVAMRIESFFVDAETRANQLDETSGSKVRQKLAIARRLLGGVDALERFSQWRTPNNRYGGEIESE